MSRKQLALRHVKMIGLASAACGVVVGCLLGMTSLLFMDTEKTERMKFQAKLEPLFDTIVEEGRTIIGAECVFACWRAFLSPLAFWFDFGFGAVLCCASS